MTTQAHHRKSVALFMMAHHSHHKKGRATCHRGGGAYLRWPHLAVVNKLIYDEK
jgi:hypothetical protein